MTKLMPMEKLSEVFEWDERAQELRSLKCKMRRAAQIHVTLRYANHTEVISLSDAPYVFDALDRYYDSIIEELERDIRALGVEPTLWVAPTDKAKDAA